MLPAMKSRQPDIRLSESNDVETTSASLPGGPLQANEKPSREALLERAAYWESHGRSDLAEKIRSRLPAEPKHVAVPPGRHPAQLVNAAPLTPPQQPSPPRESAAVEPVSSVTSAQAEKSAPELRPETVAPVSKPAKLDAEASAQYWEAHGRSDLADKALGTGSEPKIAAKAIMPAVKNKVAESGVATAETERAAEKPSRQDLDERAQYWEAHGRTDLAAQLRQKLQATEPRQVSSRTERRDTPPRADSQDAARSALEDSLLKNPNGLKARLDLAQIYRSSGEYAKSRVQIESVLASNPDLPEALYASAQLYAEQRLWMETMHTLEKVNPVSRTSEMTRLQKTAWAHLQIDRADALVRQGRNLEAEVLLRQVAAELAVNDNQNVQVEPPPLWKNAATKAVKSRR